MAISLVQATTGTSTGSSSTTSASAFSSPNTAGNAIIVALMNDSTTAVTSVTDTAGNPYTKIVGNIATDEVAIWACFNIKAATGNVVSFANGNNDGGIWAQEWSGLATSSANDQTATGTGAQTSGTITVGPTSATTVANELVLAIISLDINTGWNLAVGTGYSNFSKLTASFIGGATESKTVSSTGAQSATMTITNTSGFTWRGVIATFKAAGSAPVSHLMPLMGVGQ